MKAVVLATCYGTTVSPLTQYYPKALLPVVSRPLLDYVLHLLQHADIQEAIVVSNGKSVAINQTLGRESALRMPVRFHDELSPRGTAGCLREIREFIGRSPFVVINGGAFFDFDLTHLIAFHREKGGIASLGVSKTDVNPVRVERLLTTPDHAVEAFVVVDQSGDRRRSMLPCDVYVFEPEIFDLLPEKDYFDIKGQLLPRAKASNLPVYAFEIQSFYRSIHTPTDYFRLNMEILRGDTPSHGFIHAAAEIQEGVWCKAADFAIASSVTLVPPVFIGEGCEIACGTHLIGPVILGDGCHVGAGAHLRETLVWPRSLIHAGTQLERSLICGGYASGQDAVMRRSARAAGVRQTTDRAPLRAPYAIHILGKATASAAREVWGYRLRACLKRLFDVSVSCIALAVLSPLFLVIGITIKFDSPGDVFFRQERCGQGSRRFRMLKFRTMRKDTDTLRAVLERYSETDGPMFKMAADPRVTRIGKVLRATSLDELPQLWNVLQGTMSLVGPRPLESRDMRFHTTWRETRLRVKPGITGLWQVYGRYSNDFSSWILYDIDYVKHQSFWLDSKILLLTLWITLKDWGRLLFNLKNHGKRYADARRVDRYHGGATSP